MEKIKEILIGTNNEGKYREICDLLPKTVIKHSLKSFKITAPEENGKTFRANSLIKASYFSRKTNLICLSDDSGLEIDALNGAPGIYSSRWCKRKNDFNSAIKKVFAEIKKVKKKNCYKARFVCSLTIFWPNGKNYSSKGIIDGKVINKKKGKNGFGYDPIFVPNGYKKTFGEMSSKFKMSIDHRHEAFLKIKKFFY